MGRAIVWLNFSVKMLNFLRPNFTNTINFLVLFQNFNWITQAQYKNDKMLNLHYPIKTFFTNDIFRSCFATASLEDEDQDMEENDLI